MNALIVTQTMAILKVELLMTPGTPSRHELKYLNSKNLLSYKKYRLRRVHIQQRWVVRQKHKRTKRDRGGEPAAHHSPRDISSLRFVFKLSGVRLAVGLLVSVPEYVNVLKKR